ncbi:hypothetical protein GOP47_0020900 [Adiantum capillus-veneris]|uniref:Uncharacterized protein n=1 Tax=Adiantum capillus-veneris TaxID=13818 RepID=A0A9D4UAK1_ADICA|nr:hypothetical protein GOP47_0020900 [Adiantum capillus-veneris]
MKMVAGAAGMPTTTNALTFNIQKGLGNALFIKIPFASLLLSLSGSHASPHRRPLITTSASINPHLLHGICRAEGWRARHSELRSAPFNFVLHTYALSATDLEGQR